ncbi:hypothetical protein C8Q79DRAFT_301439 [Trametes meyenii]|nr:hypothetical protein C8Q79DRAFT_301439 [Trametes meyenii]
MRRLSHAARPPRAVLAYSVPRRSPVVYVALRADCRAQFFVAQRLPRGPPAKTATDRLSPCTTRGQDDFPAFGQRTCYRSLATFAGSGTRASAWAGCRLKTSQDSDLSLLRSTFVQPMFHVRVPDCLAPYRPEKAIWTSTMSGLDWAAGTSAFTLNRPARRQHHRRGLMQMYDVVITVPCKPRRVPPRSTRAVNFTFTACSNFARLLLFVRPTRSEAFMFESFNSPLLFPWNSMTPLAFAFSQVSFPPSSRFCRQSSAWMPCTSYGDAWTFAKVSRS